jgi:hypothetical protein
MPRHRKTVVLKRLLGTYEHIVNLWCWAADNAKDGDLSGYTVSELEAFSEWRGAPGVAVAAMVEAGFIDKDSDGMRLHRWMERTGAGVDSLLKTRHRQSELMKHRRSVSANDDANANNNPFPLSESSRSPDQDSEKKERVSLGVSANKRQRPDTAYNLVWAIKAAVEKAQPKAGMWAPDTFAQENASRLLVGLGDAAKAMPELERKITLFAADPEMQPWTVKKFCDKYNGIGHAKPIPGQPKQAVYR